MTEALAVYRRGRVEGHYEIAVAQIGYALLLLSTDKAAEAEKETREAIAIFRKVYPAGHRTLVAAESTLGESLLLQGKVEEAQEIAALFKTRADRASALIEAISELHGYDVPAAVVWPIADALPAYAQWVSDESRA